MENLNKLTKAQLIERIKLAYKELDECIKNAEKSSEKYLNESTSSAKLAYEKGYITGSINTVKLYLNNK